GGLNASDSRVSDLLERGICLVLARPRARASRVAGSLDRGDVVPVGVLTVVSPMAELERGVRRGSNDGWQPRGQGGFYRPPDCGVDRAFQPEQQNRDQLAPVC